MSTFGAADYVVFVISVSICLSIGVLFAYRGRKRQTTEDYLLGNREMKAFPVAVSVAVSYESAITLLGFPAEVYRFGMVYIWYIVLLPISFRIGLKIMVPLLHPLNITSLYEFFQLRFQGNTTRLVATVLSMLRTLLYMAVVMLGPATAIEAVTPFPYWCSILLAAGIALIYTSIGGMKAVVWTDVFQTVVMAIGMFAILLKSSLVSGGLANVFVVASEQGRVNIDKFKFDLTERTFWTLLVGGPFTAMGMIFSQPAFQRIKSVPTQKDANNPPLLAPFHGDGIEFLNDLDSYAGGGLMLLVGSSNSDRVMHIAGVTMLAFDALACFTGIFAFSYFHTIGCDPLASKRITNANQIIPLMVAQTFANYPGVIGLFIAALFSATLSSLSSALNSLAAQTTEDFVRPYFKNLTELSITKIAKMSVIVYGIIATAVSFALAGIKGSLLQVMLSVASCLIGPSVAMFIIAIFCPWATQKGTLVGVLVGSMFVAWISLGQLLSPTVRREKPLPPASTLQCQSNYNITNTTSFTTGFDWVTPNTTISSSMERSGLDNLYSLSFVMFPLVGFWVTTIVAPIVSYLTDKPRKEDMNVKYTLPLVEYCCPCLPTRLKQYLACGMELHMDSDLVKQPEDRNPFQPPEETSCFVKTDNNESLVEMQMLQQRNHNEKYDINT